MPDYVYCLCITYSSSPSNLGDAMVSDRTVDANKRPVCPICDHLSSNDGYTAVDFRIVNDRFRSRGITHTESKNEAYICHVPGIHAMPSRGDDIRCDEKARTESPGRLISEPLSSAQVLRCAEV